MDANLRAVAIGASVDPMADIPIKDRRRIVAAKVPDVFADRYFSQ